MKQEWTIEQIRDFVKKDYQSVSARMVKCLLAIHDESSLPDQQKSPSPEAEILKDELLKVAKSMGAYVDFSDKTYDGDKEAPMDAVGFIQFVQSKLKSQPPTSEPLYRWTDELVEQFAKEYRFSSSRISIEMFKRDNLYPAGEGKEQV